MGRGPGERGRKERSGVRDPNVGKEQRRRSIIPTCDGDKKMDRSGPRIQPWPTNRDRLPLNVPEAPLVMLLPSWSLLLPKYFSLFHAPTQLCSHFSPLINLVLSEDRINTFWHVNLRPKGCAYRLVVHGCCNAARPRSAFRRSCSLFQLKLQFLV